MTRSACDHGGDDGGGGGGGVEEGGVVLRGVVRLCRRHRPCPGLHWYREVGDWLRWGTRGRRWEGYSAGRRGANGQDRTGVRVRLCQDSPVMKGSPVVVLPYQYHDLHTVNLLGEKRSSGHTQNAVRCYSLMVSLNDLPYEVLG